MAGPDVPGPSLFNPSLRLLSPRVAGMAAIAKRSFAQEPPRATMRRLRYGSFADVSLSLAA